MSRVRSQGRLELWESFMMNSDTHSFNFEETHFDIYTVTDVLATVARVFDITGWLQPFQLQGRILFRNIWDLIATKPMTKRVWKQVISQSNLHNFMIWANEISKLSSVQFPRCFVRTTNEEKESPYFAHENPKCFLSDFKTACGCDTDSTLAEVGDVEETVDSSLQCNDATHIHVDNSVPEPTVEEVAEDHPFYSPWTWSSNAAFALQDKYIYDSNSPEPFAALIIFPWKTIYRWGQQQLATTFHINTNCRRGPKSSSAETSRGLCHQKPMFSSTSPRSTTKRWFIW